MGILSRLRFAKKPFGKPQVGSGFAARKEIRQDTRGNTPPLIKVKKLTEGDRRVINDILQKEGNIADATHLDITQLQDRLHAIDVRKGGRLPKIVSEQKAGMVMTPLTLQQRVLQSTAQRELDSLNPRQMTALLNQIRLAPREMSLKMESETGLIHPDSCENMLRMIKKVKRQVQ